MSSKRSNSSSSGGSSSFFSLGCGCKNSKSVSVSDSISDTSEISPQLPPPPTAQDDDQDNIVAPTFSGLLRQLSDLEKTVLSLAPQIQDEEEQQHEEERQQYRQRRRTRSMEDEGVAVVKETDDPLGDFRRSMLQMIVEKEIVTGEELRQLLKAFLSINSPRHHDVILRAFADIWNEVFSGLDPTPEDSLPRSRSPYCHRRSPR